MGCGVETVQTEHAETTLESDCFNNLCLITAAVLQFLWTSSIAVKCILKEVTISSCLSFGAAHF